MALLIAVTGGCPAALGVEDEVSGRDVLGTFDHAMDVVAVGLILFTDDEHRQLDAVSFEFCSKTFGVQLVGKVAEILLGKCVCNPLPIDHLALGKSDVDRVGYPVVEVVGFEICCCQHRLVWDLQLSPTIYMIFIF